MATRKGTDASRAAALSAAFARASLRLRTPTATPNPSFIVFFEKKKPKLLAGHSAHLSLLAFERPPKPLQVVELLHNGMAPACLMEGLHRCDSIMEWNGALKIRESGEVRYIAPTASRERAE